MKDCKVYINFSGGVDSTYYLYRQLKDRQNERVLVHHCLLNERRKLVEKIATDKILNYLRQNGMDNFVYIETRFTRQGIPGRLADMDSIGFMSSQILRAKKHLPKINKILLPYCYEETPIIRKHFTTLSKDIKKLAKRNRTRRFIETIEMYSRRTYDFVIPYMHMTKQDMINDMPDELFRMTWYCRRPKDGEPCMKCFNCRRVNNLNKK